MVFNTHTLAGPIARPAVSLGCSNQTRKVPTLHRLIWSDIGVRGITPAIENQMDNTKEHPMETRFAGDLHDFSPKSCHMFNCCMTSFMV